MYHNVEFTRQQTKSQQSGEHLSLGHNASEHGIQPTADEVIAIKGAPIPRDIRQLKSFCGLINYYAKFCPNLSPTLASLYSLLHKKAHWLWGPFPQSTSTEAKTRLSSSSLLVHYYNQEDLILTCCTSPYGIDTFLSHCKDNGSQPPIAYASRSSTPADHWYSQINKQALSIIRGVTKFKQYLLSCHFSNFQTTNHSYICLTTTSQYHPQPLQEFRDGHLS